MGPLHIPPHKQRNKDLDTTPEGFDPEKFQFMIGSMMEHVSRTGHVVLNREEFLELMQESAKLAIRSTILANLEVTNPELVQAERDTVKTKFGLTDFSRLNEPLPEQSRILVPN